jgi:NADH dehydrogenase FAD-containing subunit
MATIGRQAAVANLKWPFKAHWCGFFAWIAWLMIHIYFLIGFRNRVVRRFRVGVDLLHGATRCSSDYRWHRLDPGRKSCGCSSNS